MVDRASRPMRSMARSAQESSQKVNRLADKARKATSGLRRMGGAAGNSANHLRHLGDQANFADRKLHRLARRMRNMQTVRLGMGGALTGLGTGLLTKRVGTTLVDYEKAMNMVKAYSVSYIDKETGKLVLKGFEKTVNPVLESARALKALRNETQRISQVSIFDPTQVAEGLLELARAGFSAQEQLTALHPVMRLASAGAMVPKQALDIATNINESFGKDIEYISTTADVLATAASNANTTVAQLGQAMKYAAPSAVTAGRSMQETAGVLMALAKRGLKDSIGGTSIARMLESVYKRSGPAVKALKEIGLAHSDFMNADGGTIPIADMLDKFQAAAQKFGKSKVIMAIQAMMGSRGGRAAKLLLNASDEIRLNEKLLQLSKDRAKLMEKVMMSDLYGAYEKMRSSLYESVISLGDGGLSKDLEALAGWVKELANSFSQLDPSTKKWIGRALLLATAISAVIIPLGVFMWALGALVPIVTLVGGALALLLSPIGLVIAGLAGIATWLMHKYDISFDDIIAKVKEFGKVLEDPLGALEKLANYAFDSLKASISDLGNYILQQLVGPVSAITEFLANPFKGALNLGKGFADKLSSLGFQGLNLLNGNSTPETPSGGALAKSEADKQIALKVQTENQVKVDAPGSIILKLPNGTVAGTIPLKSSVVSRGVTTPEAGSH